MLQWPPCINVTYFRVQIVLPLQSLNNESYERPADILIDQPTLRHHKKGNLYTQKAVRRKMSLHGM